MVERAEAKDRQAVSLEYRIVNRQGSFIVVDASTRPIVDSTLAGTALKRDDVIGTPFAQTVFAIVDAIFVKDERIEEIRGRT